MQPIAIVEPVSSGLGLIDAAVARGMPVTVFSFGREDRCLPPAYADRVARVVPVDTNDEAALAEALAAAHRRQPFAGVLPGFEYFVPAVARINARLGLPGLPARDADVLRLKDRMRRRLADAGVRVPRFAHAAAAEDLPGAAEAVGFPAVIKPVDAAGSVHVTRVETLAELRDAFAAMRAETRRDLGRDLGGTVQIEEYVPGPEVSVEGIVLADGRPAVVSITEKRLGPEPHFVELGHVVEADLSAARRAAIERATASVTTALGVTLGPFHCEFRLGADQPVAIELGARLAGDRICDLIELAKGVSLADAMIDAYCGRSWAALAPRRNGVAAIRFFTAPGLARLGAIEGADALARLEGVVRHALTAKPGDAVMPPVDFRCRLGWAIVEAEHHAALGDRLAAVDRAVVFR